MRTLRALIGALAAAALPHAALAVEVLHAGARNTNGAYQFDWRSERATVVTSLGRSEASVATSGPQRLATLDAPQSTFYEVFDEDCPELPSEVRNDLIQLAVTRLSGTENRGRSKVVHIGIETTLTGCNAGRALPYGAPTDEGLATSHLATRLRPSLADLTPGVTLAGPSDQPGLDIFPAADLATFGAGTLSFSASGGSYPLANVDRWLVLDLPLGLRGFTRFAVERNGAETWIAADWDGGVPQRVFSTLMVKPATGAGFGTQRRAAHVWESGLFAGTNNPFFFELYLDGTGARVAKDLAAGTESRQPVLWGVFGSELVTQRPLPDGTAYVRTWVPLRNEHGVRFVMEDEVRWFPDGTREPRIAPRVNFYLDQGPATLPPAR